MYGIVTNDSRTALTAVKRYCGLESLPLLAAWDSISTENDKVTIPKNQRFRVLLTNFGRRPRVVLKKHDDRLLSPSCTTIMSSKMSLGYVIKLKMNEDKESTPPAMRKTNEIPQEIEFANKIELPNVPDDSQKEAWEMLKRHAHMWPRCLGEINISEYRIEFIEGANPVSTMAKGQKGNRNTIETSTEQRGGSTIKIWMEIHCSTRSRA